jgi:hypothetical protein
LSKFINVASSWWGFVNESTKSQLEAFRRKATKFGYYPATGPAFSQIVDKMDYNLFQNITTNPLHCLHPLLPPIKECKYNFGKRGQRYTLPVKDERNYIVRTLYKFV